VITVIDLKISNIASVSRALKYLKVEHKVSSLPTDIIQAEKLILPGVGSFSAGVRRLKEDGLSLSLQEAVLGKKVPILGICLGMQLFAATGEEGGISPGLGFIQGKVAYHRAGLLGLRLPHIGWNDVRHKDFSLFDSIAPDACFYFVHSYEMLTSDYTHFAYSNYGEDFIAAIQKDNIFGVQFHPEKSQDAGLKLLENFCKRNL